MTTRVKNTLMQLMSISMILIYQSGCQEPSNVQQNENRSAPEADAFTGGLSGLERIELGIDSIESIGNGFYDFFYSWDDPNIDTSLYKYLLQLEVYTDTNRVNIDATIFLKTKLRNGKLTIFHGEITERNSTLAPRTIISKLAVLDNQMPPDTSYLIGGIDIGDYYDAVISDNVVFMKTTDTTLIDSVCTKIEQNLCDYIALGDSTMLHNTTTSGIDTIEVGKYEKYNIYPASAIADCLCDNEILLNKETFRICMDTLRTIYYSTSIHQLPDSLVCEQ